MVIRMCRPLTPERPLGAWEHLPRIPLRTRPPAGFHHGRLPSAWRYQSGQTDSADKPLPYRADDWNSVRVCNPSGCREATTVTPKGRYRPGRLSWQARRRPGLPIRPVRANHQKSQKDIIKWTYTLNFPQTGAGTTTSATARPSSTTWTARPRGPRVGLLRLARGRGPGSASRSRAAGNPWTGAPGPPRPSTGRGTCPARSPRPGTPPSPSGTVLTPASGCALSGAGNRTEKVASAALAWMPSGIMPRSAAFLGLVNQQPSAAQGLFHRNRIINATGITTLSL